jgi:hypothetical protein
MERVRIFELLIEHKGRLTTSLITKSLNTTNSTAKRTMAELYGLGLVTVGQQTGNSGSPEHFIELKEKFQWFLSEEFTSVRKNTPVSYDSSVRENTYQNSKNNDNDTESNNEAHRGENFLHL